MRNILKFSLFGTLLCTMSILSSNGYSMEYIQDILEDNRIELKKTINTFNINTNPSEIAKFAEQLRTKESRLKYARQAGPASVDFAIGEYPSLNLILNNTIMSNTIEKLATKLLQDHLSFISEFSSGDVANDEVRMLFYNAWVKIFESAANSNNLNFLIVLYNLGEACFKHFNIANFYREWNCYSFHYINNFSNMNNWNYL